MNLRGVAAEDGDPLKPADRLLREAYNLRRSATHQAQMAVSYEIEGQNCRHNEDYLLREAAAYERAAQAIQDTELEAA